METRSGKDVRLMENAAPPDPAPTKPSPISGTVWNVPNQLTIARLVLSIACFVFLMFDAYLTALILFCIAAGTDWVDGYWARRYGQVTQLGRILDPFADKIIICGTFIFLAAVPPIIGGHSASEIAAWMAVVVVGREILVTALRSFVEEQGGDFSAKWAGKWKMVFQCLAVAASLARLWYYGYSSEGGWTGLPSSDLPPEWTTWSLRLVVWLAVAMTIYSGWGYVRTAMRILK
jgi:CDP-diacylglycerol--glycerol-3-phosphate 3-phosphatidyltransferase